MLNELLDKIACGPPVYAFASVVAVGAFLTGTVYAVLSLLNDPECVGEPGMV